MEANGRTVSTDLQVLATWLDRRSALAAYAAAWSNLWDELAIQDADFEAWRNGATLDVGSGPGRGDLAPRCGLRAARAASAVVHSRTQT